MGYWHDFLQIYKHTKGVQVGGNILSTRGGESREHN